MKRFARLLEVRTLTRLWRCQRCKLIRRLTARETPDGCECGGSLKVVSETVKLPQRPTKTSGGSILAAITALFFGKASVKGSCYGRHV
jgi:hypothetical protein